MPTSTHGRPYKKYTGPGEVLMDTIYVNVKKAPDGHIYVWWKGTGEDPRDVVGQWEEDGILAAGGRSPALDRDLNYVINRWGMESQNVSHDGFSRGGAPARLCNGRGYGDAVFAAYPPGPNSEHVESEYGWTNMYDDANSWIHNKVVHSMSNALAGIENATGVHATPFTPTITGEGHIAIATTANAKRAPEGFLEPPLPKKPRQNPRIGAGGDFSGLVTTFVVPTTGRIINYKGIPSKKRKYSALAQYSPFWKDQLTQPSVLVGPSQA